MDLNGLTVELEIKHFQADLGRSMIGVMLLFIHLFSTCLKVM